jgi:peptide chain release factor 1
LVSEAMQMLEKLAAVERRFCDLERLLATAGGVGDQREYARLAKEHADLVAIVEKYREWRRVEQQIREGKALLEDEDAGIREMAKAELPELRARLETLEGALKTLLVPRDPNDERSVILEVRAGTGGEEACLFASDLARMYGRYAEHRGWRFEIMSSSATGLGGVKEIIASVEGRGAYSRFKFEGGVHRVQRVPVTEGSGRIHTSTVTVAVLPEADEVDVKIDDRDLRIDVFRSSGPGGQSVNTTDSAVRITHLPSGLVVTCQDEKSQHKNKAKGLKILRSRLLERAIAEQQSQIAASRRSMVGTGDRSERIRTYNFREGRVTDHRIGLTLYSLDRVLDGTLDLLIDPLLAHHQAEVLQAEHEPGAGTREVAGGPSS